MMAAKRTEDTEQLTAFAQALQEWGWYENKPPITTRVKLADRIHVPRSTLSAWFSPTNPTVPRGHAWHVVKDATGWTEARMLELTGMDAPPDDVLTLPDFLRADLETTHRFTLPGKAPIRAWLTEAIERWQSEPSQRQTRKRRRKTRAAETPTETPAEPTPLRRDRDRELAHSGK